MATPKPKHTPFREALRRAVYQGRNYQHRGMTIHQIMDDITAQIAPDHPIEDAAPQLLEAFIACVAAFDEVTPSGCGKDAISIAKAAIAEATK